MSLPLMIFAAGKGTRMAPLTDTTPKPLLKVSGRTLLDRAIDLGREAGVGRIVVNAHYLGGQIHDHLAGGDILISDETDALLETGGGLRKALPLLGGGAVMTLNPDVVWTGPNPLSALQMAWDPQRMDCLLMLLPRDRARGRVGPGDFTLSHTGKISRGGDMVYVGCQICKTERLAEIREDVFSLNSLWDLMIADGRAYGISHIGEWCDVGRPETIALAEEMLAEDVV
ncbi:nucleotidyltransferase family protein [Paracoccus aerodenitrificans]|uniref:nucleotidyltransferase family protein n=1 Tax=Paracoccus aerodenitrificans TaxID=3017781 RepID=UPI0022F0692D|nr:nucleotidyltransferase family protein [Paracoccus aerodenitrificans]WBU63819.1 nucleotidyltransferase family protein [Paracoccus aerodenitrificans]